MDHHVTVALKLVFELAVAYLTVVQKLSLALPGLEAVLFIGVLHFLVVHVVSLADVFKKVLHIRVFLLAEAAVLLDLLVHSLHVYFEVAFTEAIKRAQVTVEFLPGVFPHMNTKIGLYGAGVVTLRALEWFLIGVDS